MVVAAAQAEAAPMPGSARVGMLFAILALVFFAINFVLTPNTPYPVVPDDFLVLGGGLVDMGWHWKRPVAANTIFLVGQAGPAFAFFAISALAVVTAGLVLVFLGQLFGLRWHWLSMLAFATIVSSHVSAFEHSKYLGLLTNLTSHLFGLATLLLLWQAWRRGGAWRWLATGLVFLLSAFAKEDFLLPPLLLLVFLWFDDMAGRRARLADVPRRRAKFAASAGLWMIAVGSLLWNAYDRNPFVAGLFRPRADNGSYAVELGLPSLAQSAWTLFAGYVPVVSALALIAWVALWWSRPALRSRLALHAGLVGALALPYMLIPNNMPLYRAYAWLPWLAGLVVVALQVWSQSATDRHPRSPARFAPAFIGLGLVLAVASWHQDARLQLAARYQGDEAVNRRMIASLQRHRDAIRGDASVGLHGLVGRSPWCGNDAVYVNAKLGFAQRWVVFVPAESGCYKQWPPDRRKKRGIHVSVVPASRLCDFKGLKVLDFALDGTARLRAAEEFCTALP